MDDSTGHYLNGIGLVPLLTKEDEVNLAKTIERGREAQAELDAGKRNPRLKTHVRNAERAQEQFIRANLRLVVSVAKKYPLPTGMELLDLIQEGNLGLDRAVDKFDWRKGFKFSTYATFWIRQSIGRALDQKANLIRLPGERAASLRAAVRQASGGGEELDTENALLHRLTSPTSLNTTVGDDNSNELLDLQPDTNASPEDLILAADRMNTLSELLQVLDERSRFALEMRFGLVDGQKHSYREIGEVLGLTSEAIRRIIGRSLDSVRDHAELLNIDAA
ncbi:MAG: sigma-70 family RNA polymerase sigma factor [Acidimicrobiia bacterium]|nr:sigma-70 family RNA polymerase sigma factor [Acidimicrobiia bacterium]MYC58129.1 sigma-70 family RNA polymerase sigma factor [Acidimicrobiia bacterium]MYG94381.1 sigma-70 family RNA polymerase sigma factor [Acidimicrobiia bacterium]MYI30561.1 sigma-70 family RNA polymerase sigma factor [Acidimicrobiia bacterium]